MELRADRRRRARSRPTRGARPTTTPTCRSSALWFAVQLTPDDPQGEQRPSPLSDDPDERKEQLDVDGEMPGWMANAIVKAMIETFTDHPHPQIYLGEAFQQQIDQGMLTSVVKDRDRPRARPAVP